MNVLALLRAIPISGIEAQWLAVVEGFVPGKRVVLYEPPAGQRVPFVDPINMTSILFQHDGVTVDHATEKAKELYAEMREKLSLCERPVLYNDCSDMRKIPEYVPLSKWLDILEERQLVSDRILTFLRQACEVTTTTRMFARGDFGTEVLCLSELPDLPPPKAMIEFFVGLPDDLVKAHFPDWEDIHYKLLEEWKAFILPIAEALEKELGEPVYYFADPECDIDDDNCHRFLALHCWCSLLPDSSFVRYLLEVTELSGVKELKAALVNPANYTYPWKMCNAFFGIDVGPICHFNYLPQDTTDK